MKSVSSLAACLATAVRLLALATLVIAVRGDLRINGIALNNANGLPVADAVVSFNLNPPDSTPEVKISADAFGTFRAPALAAGSYTLTVDHPAFASYQTNFTALDGITNQVIRLAPVDGKTVFDLFAQVYCLATHAALVGGRLVVEHWQPDGVLSGPPDNTFFGNIDAAGAVTMPLMPEGFYRLSAERAGWETLTYVPPPGGDDIVIGDKVRLSKSHFASIFLRPKKTDLKIIVRGFDPVANEPDRFLKDMVIQITGLDLSNPKLELVPTLSAPSAPDGSYTFKKRPPIRWRVTIGRPGYVPAEVIVSPRADGTFADTTIDMMLAPTKLKILTESVYKLADSTAGAVVKLEGLRASNTEGISRELTTTAETTGFNASALFKNILPGRYWMRIQHSTTITNFPNRSGPISIFNSFKASFFPTETFAELILTNTTEKRVFLKVIPARVRGRLFASDQLADVETVLAASANDQKRVYHSLAANGVTFVEAKAASLISDPANLVAVDTDASGHFLALVTPGLFGVQIPTLANYTGHEIEAGVVSEGFGMFGGGWPYADIWPHATYDSSRHRQPLNLNSDEEMQLNLYVHRQYVNFCGFILNPFSDPFRNIVLSVPKSGSPAVTNNYNHFYDTQTKVRVAGPVTVDAPVLADGSYVARDLPPGTYTLSLNHPDYTTPTKTVTVAPWNAPGILPPVAITDPTHWYAGLTQSKLSLNLQPSWKATGLIRINRKVYFTPPEGAPYYGTVGQDAPQYFQTSALPGRLFTFVGGGVPAPSWIVYLQHGDGWFAAAGSGEATLDAYEGGPLDNTSPDNFPGEFNTYTVDLHAYSLKDRRYELTNVNVTFASGDQRLAGGVVTVTGQPQVTTAADTEARWTLRTSATEIKMTDPFLRRMTVNVFLDRSMTITGIVSSATGGVIPRAALSVHDRYGAFETTARVLDDGSYKFIFLSPQALFLEIQARGFKTKRIYVGEPNSINPDQAVDVVLDPVPAPAVSEFSMNRFGLFLPGVSMSGYAGGFNPQNAAERLTATWKAKGIGQTYQVALPGYFDESNERAPDEVKTIQDKVSEIYLIDRRAFTNAFVNELDQSAFQQNLPPASLDYVRVTQWLKEIKTASRAGQPYFVVHQLQRADPDTEGAEGKLALWELPSGVFKPMLLLITQAGGVAVRDYDPTTAAGAQGLLQGLGVSRAVANLLDTVGTAANFPSFEKFGFANFGSGFFKIGSVTPGKSEGRIGLDPSNAKLEDDAYLTYKYALGLELALGEGSTPSGPMSFGPNFLGLKPKGVTVEFEVSGRDKKVSFGPVFGLTTPDELEERDSSYRPILAEGAELGNGNKFEAKPEVSAKVVFSQTLDADWLGANRVSAVSFGVEGQGKVEMEARFNASPITTKIPYIGPVLFGLDKTGAFRTFAVLEATLGGKILVEMESTFPASSGTVTSSDAPRFDVVGGTTTKTEVKLFLRLAGGIQVSAFRDSITGTALLQVGAPADAPDSDGVVFSINPIAGHGNLITKIEGALSFILKGELHLWTFRARKQWQWDIKRFVVDRNSEPSFELANLNIAQTIISPGTSAPQIFKASGSNIVENFFPAGTTSVTPGANPLLAFTGLAANGQMQVMVSARGAERWNTPQAIATADGIVSLAVHDLPDGRALVVWSEIAEHDLGNPFPASTVRYAISDAARAAWSIPTTLHASVETMFDLKMSTVGSKSMLLFLSAAEGLDGPKGARFATFDGSAWTSPAALENPLSIRSLALNSSLAAFTTADGELRAFDWDGSSWSPGTVLATNASRGVALHFPMAAWITESNQIEAATWNPTAQTWAPIGVQASSALGHECALISFRKGDETLWLLAWTSGADRNSIFYTVFDGVGASRLAATELTVGSAGIYDRLRLRATPEGRVTLIAAYTQDSTTSLRDFVVGLPNATDCDGDGVADATAIATGLVADCNLNGIPDFCEIRQGTATDRNHNGVIDSCEPPIPDDCNRNGVSDRYELSLGIGDLNNNGLLDDCEGDVLVKTVPLPTTVQQRYYRAPGLRIRSRTATTIDLEYHGVLEQTDNLNTPFGPAN